ncbi:MAG: CBS domain-containing protein [Acidobacteriia bacterium]|nr:CBS domain-containing protein [Terriglobia bacterium]
MLVKDAMSRKVVFCAPSDTAQEGARIMKTHGVGALPVVSDLASARIEGIVTDRDLCCRIVAEAKLAETTKIADVMTRNPVTCAPENTLEDCESLMQKHQIRRVPVVDDKGRCVGIVAQTDIVAYASVAEIAKTLGEISKAQKGRAAGTYAD